MAHIPRQCFSEFVQQSFHSVQGRFDTVSKAESVQQLWARFPRRPYYFLGTDFEGEVAVFAACISRQAVQPVADCWHKNRGRFLYTAFKIARMHSKEAVQQHLMMFCTQNEEDVQQKLMF